MKNLLLKSVLFICVFLLSGSYIYSQWVAQTSGVSVTLRNVKVVNENVVWACGSSGTVIKTVNGGTSWRLLTPTVSTATNYTVESFDTTTAWVTGTVGGSANVTIWKTTDGGTTWNSQYNNPTGFGDGVKFFDSNNGVYFGDPDPWPSGNWELLTTSNGGTVWNRVPRTNFPPADSVNEEYGAACAMETFGNIVWFGAYSAVAGTPNRIYKSTDKGLNWTVAGYNPASGTSGSHYMAFRDANNGINVSLSGSMAQTTDGGTNWTVTNLAPQAFRFITNIAGFNSYIAVGSTGLATYTTDGGANWTTMTTGVTGHLYSVDAIANAAWAVGATGTVLKLTAFPVPVELTSFSAIVDQRNVVLDWSTATEINNRGFEIQRKSVEGDFVSIAFIDGKGTTQQTQSYSYVDRNVEYGRYTYRLKQVDYNGNYSYSDPVEVDARIPAKFALNQNYPNPFNPSTKISYEVARESNVTLKIYDAIGNEVATLINETKPAGTYEITFNASNLSNGVYFYKLQAGNFTSTKKLILMK